MFVWVLLIAVSAAPNFPRTCTSDGVSALSAGATDPYYVRFEARGGFPPGPLGPLVCTTEGTFYGGNDASGSNSPSPVWIELVWGDPILKYYLISTCTITAKADSKVLQIVVNSVPQSFPRITYPQSTVVQLNSFSSGPGFAPNNISFLLQDTDGNKMGLAVINVDCASTDVNECVSNPCANGTVCINQIGADPVCSDINECATNNGGCAFTCENAYGTFHCHYPTDCVSSGCNPGYYCSDTPPYSVCLDVNECEEGDPCGGPTLNVCVNTNGSFYCDCAPGSAQSTMCSPSCNCADINECDSNNGGCDARFTTCVNTIGSFLCEDINECDFNNGGCGAYASCVNLINTGFNCVDINECAISNGGCSIQYQECINQYELPVVCIDINECATNNGNCDSFSRCVNVVDGPQECFDLNECSVNNGNCETGFACVNHFDSAQTCIDINECASFNGGCSVQFQLCVNSIGNFSCIDVNECASLNGGCSNLTTCVNNNARPPSCVDINECGTNNGGCNAAFTTCVNIIDGGFVCADINECATNNGGCGLLACDNKYGAAPTCSVINLCAISNGGCSATFETCSNTALGVQCTDINECLTNNGNCPLANTTCINQIRANPVCQDVNECASFNGGCNVPYQTCVNLIQTGFYCRDVNECATSNGGCVLDYSICINVNNNPAICQDVNECATNDGGCDSFETCVNNLFSAQTCIDTNECASNNGGCPVGGSLCVNLDPGFQCVDINGCATNYGGCDPNYSICVDQQYNAPVCNDINECATNNGNCSAECINLNPGFECNDAAKADTPGTTDSSKPDYATWIVAACASVVGLTLTYIMYWYCYKKPRDHKARMARQLTEHSIMEDGRYSLRTADHGDPFPTAGRQGELSPPPSPKQRTSIQEEAHHIHEQQPGMNQIHRRSEGTEMAMMKKINQASWPPTPQKRKPVVPSAGKPVLRPSAVGLEVHQAKPSHVPHQDSIHLYLNDDGAVDLTQETSDEVPNPLQSMHMPNSPSDTPPLIKPESSSAKPPRIKPEPSIAADELNDNETQEPEPSPPHPKPPEMQETDEGADDRIDE